MGNKKIIIGIIALILLVGTGTFVFAGRDGEFDEDSIDYRNDPTYKKVEENIKGQEVPVIIDNDVTNNDSDNNTGNDQNTSEDDNNSTTTNPGQNNTGSSSTGTSTGNRNPNGNNGNTGGTNTGTNTGSQNGGSGNGNGTNNTTPEKPGTVVPKPEEPGDNKEVEFKAELSYSYNENIKTNQDIKVTIKANKPIENISDKNGVWIISGNTAEKTFKENASGVVTVTNNGKSIALPYSIDKIDKVKLVANVFYSETNKTYKPIEVIIKSDKDIEAISEKGWIYIDKKTISKQFEENIEKTIVIEDEAKNKTEVKYTIANYEDSPITTTNKNKDNTEITITYKEPIEGIDNWQQLENGDWQATIPINKNENGAITLPNGEEIKYEAAPNLDIKNISNQNPDGTWNKTNKPVTITVKSDKPLLVPEGLENWTLSEDKKTLTFEVTKSGSVTIYDESGNSNLISYNVQKIDVIPPKIWDDGANIDYYNGLITVMLETTERSSIIGEGWDSDAGVLFTKKYQENATKSDIVEIIKFKDSYDNISTYKITIYFDGAYKIKCESIS